MIDDVVVPRDVRVEAFAARNLQTENLDDEASQRLRRGRLHLVSNLVDEFAAVVARDAVEEVTHLARQGLCDVSPGFCNLVSSFSTHSPLLSSCGSR